MLSAWSRICYYCTMKRRLSTGGVLTIFLLLILGKDRNCGHPAHSHAVIIAPRIAIELHIGYEYEVLWEPLSMPVEYSFTNLLFIYDKKEIYKQMEL